MPRITRPIKKSGRKRARVKYGKERNKGEEMKKRSFIPLFPSSLSSNTFVIDVIMTLNCAFMVRQTEGGMETPIARSLAGCFVPTMCLGGSVRDS